MLQLAQCHDFVGVCRDYSGLKASSVHRKRRTRCRWEASLKATIGQLRMAFISAHSWSTIQSKLHREPSPRFQKR